MQRALIAGHANGAAVAVAGSWAPNQALLNRHQLEEFVEPALAEPPAEPNRRLTRIVVGGILAAILIGFTLLAAGAL